ncbi:MAG: DNA mismatch endonuclease Vsr [Firmicutes bacterium]|nr:DNA mismatch endonuclease Vsr [Bacillota bacterium]
MADVHSKETRSYNMSRIRSKGTKPEEMVCKYLFSRGLRYRKNDKRYPGRPDIVLPKYRTIVFVNGCFWHYHENCKSSHIPKSNSEYWRNKIERNVQRDNVNHSILRGAGWTVIVVWECELKEITAQQRLEKLYKQIVE